MGVLHRATKRLFFGRFQKSWRWPDRIAQDGWERVSFASASGARLQAIFGEAHDGGAHGAVVLAHPMGVAAKGFWLKYGHADLLRSSGFHVLAFDFNGFGESESTNYDFPADVVAAGEYLRDRVAPLPIGVLGCSFGAGYALCAMSKENHPFRAAVLESAFPSLPYYWRSYRAPHFFLRLSQLVYPRFERELRPILAATRVKSDPHVFLIHGDADQISPVHVGRDLERAMTGRAQAELWCVAGADHNLAFKAQPDEYGARVVGFLRRALA